MASRVEDDEFLLDPKETRGLSEAELLTLDQGLINASDLENGLQISKGALRKFAQAQSDKGVDVYKEFGIGRPSFSNRYFVRLAVFNKSWNQIKAKMKEMRLTQGRFKIPPEGSTIRFLIEEGGVYKLSRLEGMIKFKVRSLKLRYYELLKAGKDPKEEFGIYKDGKLFLVDMKRFGDWYRRQELH